jgi:hypothetical protein
MILSSISVMLRAYTTFGYSALKKPIETIKYHYGLALPMCVVIDVGPANIHRDTRCGSFGIEARLWSELTCCRASRSGTGCQTSVAEPNGHIEHRTLEDMIIAIRHKIPLSLKLKSLLGLRVTQGQALPSHRQYLVRLWGLMHPAYRLHALGSGTKIIGHTAAPSQASRARLIPNESRPSVSHRPPGSSTCSVSHTVHKYA